MSTYIRWEGTVRETKTRVQILDLLGEGSEFSPERDADTGKVVNRWATLCMDHSIIVTHSASQLAWDHAAHPLGWCEFCNGTATPIVEAPAEVAEALGLCSHTFKTGATCSREAGHRGKHKPAEAAPVEVAVWGPNLGRGGEAMHVHKPGCADTRKGIYVGHKPWTITVTSAQEIVEDIYQDMIAESDGDWRDYAGDVHIYPCVGELDDATQS